LTDIDRRDGTEITCHAASRVVNNFRLQHRPTQPNIVMLWISCLNVIRLCDLDFWPFHYACSGYVLLHVCSNVVHKLGRRQPSVHQLWRISCLFIWGVKTLRFYL